MDKSGKIDWVVPRASSAAVPVHDDGRMFPVRRIYCVGRNYAAHAREMGEDHRKQPFFFSKPADAVCTTALVPFPPATDDLHHEVEMVIALLAGGSQLTPEQAAECIYGYAVGVDLTRRDLQAEAKAMRHPWTLAKGFDASAPISAIMPREKAEPHLPTSISLSVNESVRQQGDTRDMIWQPAELLSNLSGFVALAAGDLVFTGTPAGVSRLVPGDRVQCRLEGIAELEFSLSR